MFFRIFSLLAVVLMCSATANADSIDNLSEQLIKLRSEVESLSGELVLLRQEHKQKMLGLVSQQTEIQSSVRSVQRKSSRLQKEIESKKSQLEIAGVDDKQLKPVVSEAVRQLTASIESRLPFMRNQRLSSLLEIQTNMDKGLVSAHKSAKLLWSFIEDEFSLTRENGIYRQEVTTDEGVELADVVKLGMVGLFYRTTDNKYGMAVKTAGAVNGWRYQPLENSAQQSQIDYVTDSFNKQIRNGFFEVPNFIAGQSF